MTEGAVLKCRDHCIDILSILEYLSLQKIDRGCLRLRSQHSLEYSVSNSCFYKSHKHAPASKLIKHHFLTLFCLPLLGKF